MKKLFTLAVLLTCAFTAGWAQETKLIFTDKDGNPVPSGSEITIVGQETPSEWGDMEVIIETGLYVKNTDDDELSVLVDYQIEEMPNGGFQICFPQNCIPQETTGHWQTPAGILNAGESKPLLSEWLPTLGDYGTARVTYQIIECEWNIVTSKYEPATEGSKVTVNFVYPDPAGLQGIRENKANIVARHSISGQRLDAPRKGINILSLSNGRIIKSIVK